MSAPAATSNRSVRKQKSPEFIFDQIPVNDNDNDCVPSAGYSVNVAAQILDWKVAHPYPVFTALKEARQEVQARGISVTPWVMEKKLKIGVNRKVPAFC